MLLEWALEVLVKNGLDALAGRGGRMYLTTKRLDPERVRVRVADDGPGIPRELRAQDLRSRLLHQGIGVGDRALARETHSGGESLGRLLLAPSEKGATFDVILPG